MFIAKVILLALIQGFTELLPVSSSAHVVVAEKLMGLNPSSPQMTLLLVLLHSGTMFAVIVFFWKTWKLAYFSSAAEFKRFAVLALSALVLTGAVGQAIKMLIVMLVFQGQENVEIEQLFSHLELIAPALLAAGLFILAAGLLEKRRLNAVTLLAEIGSSSEAEAPVSTIVDEHLAIGNADGSLRFGQAYCIGLVQGLAIPFRGFSRSGTTISTGMLLGVAKGPAERFSFALAVLLTPAAVGVEIVRLLRASHAHLPGAASVDVHGALRFGLLGMVFSFIAGLLALKWLSSWLRSGRWYLFGIYCVAASAVVMVLHLKGF